MEYAEGGLKKLDKLFEKLKGKRAKDILDDLKLRTHPIPIEYILWKYGIELKIADFDEKRDILGGIGIYEDGNVIMGVSANSDYNSKRFTVAHELGHLCLHSQDIIDRGGYIAFAQNLNDIGDAKEIEANAFASELLIPERNIKKAHRQLFIPFLRMLADEFEVSVNVMRERLINLRLNYVE